MSLKDLPIVAKVLLIVAVFGLFSGASTLFSAREMNRISNGYQVAIADQGKSAVYFGEASSALNDTRAAIAELLISTTDAGNEAALAALKKGRSAWITSIEKADAANPEHGFDDLKKRGLNAIDVACKKTLALGAASTTVEGNAIAGVEYMAKCAPALQALVPEVSKLVDQAIESQDCVTVAMADLSDRAIKITFAVVLGGLLVVVAGATFGIRRGLSQPVRRLTATMDQLAGGHLDISVDATDRRDEIGRMARAVQVFKENGLQLRATEREAERMRAAAEVERKRADQDRAESKLHQDRVVEGLAAGLDRLSAGDLTYRIETAFAPVYERLRAMFNEAIAQVEAALKHVSTTTSAIRSGTREISTASDDLSRRTEQQAASLEQTAAALDEITVTVKTTSDGSRHAQSIVATAKTTAERSGAVVRDAVRAMGAIETSSQQVSQIIGVIDEIAFQTNLLALNAGVEAARAGEAGRGFAVVASEVRALAQRSAAAAKEIKMLISSSGRQVSQGVELVNQTGRSLELIVAQVIEVDAVVSAIATSTKEQSTALEEVNTAINQMDQITQQNAAMVEQSTAASHAVAKEADNLAKLVARFKTDETVPQAPANASRPAMTTRLAKTPSLVTSNRTSAARKLEPIGDTQSWEEF